MNGRVFAAASIVFGVTGGIAFAHHGWGNYDASKTMTLETVVTQLQWQNPHVEMNVNHDGAAWTLVLAPPFRMQATDPQQAGTIAPGTKRFRDLWYGDRTLSL